MTYSICFTRIPTKFFWKNKDICKLFKSAAMGLMIGQMAVWPKSKTLPVAEEPLSINVPDSLVEGLDVKPGQYSGNGFWVVDGQQRITSFS